MASDIFAKIGDIKGESTDSKHKDEIEVLSFSWGVTNSAKIKGGGAGKAILSPIFPSCIASTKRLRIVDRVRHGRAPEGSHHHASQGGQRPAGVPHHQDERCHCHRRHARRQQRRGGIGDREYGVCQG